MTQFKTEVIQKKESAPTSELNAIYKIFKLDKSKFQSGCKQKQYDLGSLRPKKREIFSRFEKGQSIRHCIGLF